jgi:transcriptional regulator with XRE-family HTH domain
MKIAQIRKGLGMTQAELAERCGTTQQQIARIETGAVDPRVSTVRRIAEALNVEPGTLFYSRAEFLDAISDVARRMAAGEFGESLMTGLLALNARCAREKHIPSFDPLWEEVVIEGERIHFKAKEG